MGKPQAVRVPSDDCVVTVGRAEYHPHEGEWVEMVPGITVGDLKLLRGLAGLHTQLEALEPEEGATDEAKIAAGAQSLAMTDDSMGGVIALLQRTVRGWSWTDDAGAPLPQPLDDPQVFLRLRIEELMYLTLVAKGDSPAAQKKGLRPSPTTS